MVRYNIDDVHEEMVLAESIVLPTGELLLAAGYKIKERYKQRLKQLGYTNILVEVEGTEDVKISSTISDEAQREMAGAVNASSKELATAFQQFRQSSNVRVKEIIKENRQHLSKFIMSSGMSKALEQFIDEIMSQSSIVLNLSALQQTKSEYLNHALNVTITALCIGKKYRFSYEEMKQLGIGALNFDLGLIALPQEVLEKRPDQMNEAELKLYRQHTLFGYFMLAQNHVIPATSAAVALQHHECENGSGYPRGLRGDNRPPLKDFSRQNKIHRFAEIVAVADTYDMLMTGRNVADYTRKGPIDVMKQIIGLGEQILNTDIVKTLTSIVPIFPIGAPIRISEAPTPQLVGYYGVVARDNPENLENPAIVIYETKNRQKIKPILIDLAKYKGFVLDLII